MYLALESSLKRDTTPDRYADLFRIFVTSARMNSLSAAIPSYRDAMESASRGDAIQKKKKTIDMMRDCLGMCARACPCFYPYLSTLPHMHNLTISFMEARASSTRSSSSPSRQTPVA